MTKWMTEVEYEKDEQGYRLDNGVAVHLSWCPITEGNAKDYLDIASEYSVFDTEKEAAEDFLQSIKDNPQARYAPHDYQYALDAVLRQ